MDHPSAASAEVEVEFEENEKSEDEPEAVAATMAREDEIFIEEKGGRDDRSQMLTVSDALKSFVQSTE